MRVYPGPMLDPRLLRAFVAIVDAGGFTAAAERLHMTQSTVSQQLGRLEEAVGHVLVDRTMRPARPTEAGERLLGHARRILSLQQEAETLLVTPAGAIPIRIGLPDDIAASGMSRVFASFAGRHREIRLDVTTGLSRDLAARYHAGEFDIAVVKEPVAGDGHRASFPEAIGWFESARREEAWPDPVPLVAFPVGGLYREPMFARIEQRRRRWYVAFTGSSLGSVLAAVEAGLGISLVPVGAAANYRVRPCAGFTAERPMAVSLYAWENTGPIGTLVGLMGEALAQRALRAGTGG